MLPKNTHKSALMWILCLPTLKIIAQDRQLHSKLSHLGKKRADEFSWQKTGLATAAILNQYLGCA